MSELYNKIETLCKAHEITITTMCKNAGVSRSSLTDLKSGRSKELSAVAITKIAKYFGVSIDYFIGEENGDKKSTPADDISKSAPEWIDQLSDTELVKVDEYVKFLISQRGSDK